MALHLVSALGREEGYTVKYTPPPELLKAEGYIWPYIPSRVLIRTFYHFNNHEANVYLIIHIDNKSVYSLGSVLCNIPLAPRKYWRVWYQYSIVKNDIRHYKWNLQSIELTNLYRYVQWTELDMLRSQILGSFEITKTNEVNLHTFCTDSFLKWLKLGLRVY